jgi:diaminopimelate decarboxylase
MAETSEYVSFLVRIWLEPGKDGAAAAAVWAAEVESIQTGETRRFSEMAELTDFFQNQTIGH